ncbi:unnamed protein product [Vitrella brassicaformis CCMP3155]|uniref:Uncharacterized protein n=2 Tax=Vitrella brassicaformis TaxID=1169539 RepID=A0A0G4EEL5_VITBC|nr:unnamed protein product [Vitrella brassicaformis CCMP3155]|eukprot:CEL93841.1 unnamed protein product [Vitrella brassicaformis CCMP3155]
MSGLLPTSDGAHQPGPYPLMSTEKDLEEALEKVESERNTAQQRSIPNHSDLDDLVPHDIHRDKRQGHANRRDKPALGGPKRGRHIIPAAADRPPATTSFCLPSREALGVVLPPGTDGEVLGEGADEVRFGATDGCERGSRAMDEEVDTMLKLLGGDDAEELQQRENGGKEQAGPSSPPGQSQVTLPSHLHLPLPSRAGRATDTNGTSDDLMLRSMAGPDSSEGPHGLRQISGDLRQQALVGRGGDCDDVAGADGYGAHDGEGGGAGEGAGYLGYEGRMPFDVMHRLMQYQMHYPHFSPFMPFPFPPRMMMPFFTRSPSPGSNEEGPCTRGKKGTRGRPKGRPRGSTRGGWNVSPRKGRGRGRGAKGRRGGRATSKAVTPPPPGMSMAEDPPADDGSDEWRPEMEGESQDGTKGESSDEDEDEYVPRRVSGGLRVPKLLEVGGTGQVIIEEEERYRPPPKSRRVKVEGYLRRRETGVEEVTIHGLKISKDDLLGLCEVSTIPPKLRFEYEDGMTLTLGEAGREMLRRCIRLKGLSGTEQGQRICLLKNEDLLRLAYRCDLWGLVQRLHLEHMRRLPLSVVHQRVRAKLSRQPPVMAKATTWTPMANELGAQMLLASEAAHQYHMAQMLSEAVAQSSAAAHAHAHAAAAAAADAHMEDGAIAMYDIDRSLGGHHYSAAAAAAAAMGGTSSLSPTPSLGISPYTHKHKDMPTKYGPARRSKRGKSHLKTEADDATLTTDMDMLPPGPTSDAERAFMDMDPDPRSSSSRFKDELDDMLVMGRCTEGDGDGEAEGEGGGGQLTPSSMLQRLTACRPRYHPYGPPRVELFYHPSTAGEESGRPSRRHQEEKGKEKDKDETEETGKQDDNNVSDDTDSSSITLMSQGFQKVLTDLATTTNGGGDNGGESASSPTAEPEPVGLTDLPQKVVDMGERASMAWRYLVPIMKHLDVQKTLSNAVMARVKTEDGEGGGEAEGQESKCLGLSVPSIGLVAIQLLRRDKQGAVHSIARKVGEGSMGVGEATGVVRSMTSAAISQIVDVLQAPAVKKS